MDNEILKLLNQEVVETRKLANEAKRQADAAPPGDRLRKRQSFSKGWDTFYAQIMDNFNQNC